MTTPTLALLIPAYNAAAFLPRLLESARQQTVPFDEIWVYDDCSTDDTAAVAERLGARVVRGQTNRGCTFGKSVLVGQTSCEWIHFHAADDLLLPGFVARANWWMAQSDVDVVAFGCEERWEESRELIGVTAPDDAAISADPVGYTIAYKINAISGLYRREAFLRAGGFDLDPLVLYNEDQACHCSLARAGLRFRGDPTVIAVNLRQRVSMWTANQAKALRSHYHVMSKALSHPTGNRHREAVAQRLWSVAGGAASQLDWETADLAASLAARIASPAVAPAGAGFQALCRLSPSLAVRTRELLVRALKPRLRVNCPGWRGPIDLL